MKKLCMICGERPARFKYRGQVKADRCHNICMQCSRSIKESNKQKNMAAFVYSTLSGQSGANDGQTRFLCPVAGPTAISTSGT
jgi:protein-arginine kinase activator protein McsA